MSGGQEVAAVWKVCLEDLEKRIALPYFASIIAPLKPVSINNGTFTVAAPNSFNKDIVEKNYSIELDEAASGALGRDVKVVVTVSPSGEAVEKTASRSAEPADPDPASPDMHQVADVTQSGESGQLKKYTFDNFVVGNSNHFAYNTAIMVAENPGAKYNPLFIYGGTGLGKTHLLFAIKDYAETLNPSIKVKYIRTSAFIDEFIQTVTWKKTHTFDQKYIDNKIVLFDDIQTLGKTESTQDKFFDLFNLLYSLNTHIVLTSDRPPGEIERLSERIQSRFMQGLMIDIKPPDLETRLAILRLNAAAEKVEIPDDAMIYIASKVNSNIRVLEGLFNRVVASSRLYGTRIDLEMVQDVLKDQVAETDQARSPSVDLIQTHVSNYYNIPRVDLISMSRSRSLVHARQVAMYLCRELAGETLISIGDRFGGRHHATVIHSCRNVETMLKQRKDVLQEVRELTNIINRSC